jgi:beta-lactamase superfamily II metal-dependent hydrolase
MRAFDRGSAGRTKKLCRPGRNFSGIGCPIVYRKRSDMLRRRISKIPGGGWPVRTRPLRETTTVERDERVRETAMTEGFEVDFLPVGDGERCGDAIAIRFGSEGRYKVLVYDGGTRESGRSLVEYIKLYYQTSHIDYLVNSHPDAGHASGLSVVMDQMTVGEVWIHQPWKYSPVISRYLQDRQRADNSPAARLREEMSATYELERLALRKGIPINEPFLGSAIGPFVVLSPEEDWYVQELIPAFEKSTEQNDSGAAKGAARVGGEAGKATAGWIAEQWDVEMLRENAETSAENESSVILFGVIDNKGILLTGDAGIKALTKSVDLMAAKRLSLPGMVHFLQVPHHGSRCNVSSSVLDRIVGSRKGADDGKPTKTAFVSVSKMSATHPRKSVVNALIRRGVNVFATKGMILHHQHNMPQRDGWETRTPALFSNEREAWE